MAQHGMVKQDLLKEATGTFGVGRNVHGERLNIFSTEGRDNDDLLGATNTIQEKTFESTGRINSKIEDAKLVGAGTLETLQVQKEQLQGITNEVDSLETRVEKAKRLVMGFTKKIANDRFIQFFAFVNCVLIITIILYVILEKKGIGKVSNDSGHPASSNSSSAIISTLTTSSADPKIHQAALEKPGDIGINCAFSLRTFVGNILITLLMH